MLFKHLCHRTRSVEIIYLSVVNNLDWLRAVNGEGTILARREIRGVKIVIFPDGYILAVLPEELLDSALPRGDYYRLRTIFLDCYLIGCRRCKSS